MKSAILDEVKQLIIGLIDISSELDEAQELSRIGVDSLLSIRLIVELENRFEVTFDDEDLLLENFSTPISICKMVENKLVTK